jgi:leucyl aminopeptidase
MSIFDPNMFVTLSSGPLPIETGEFLLTPLPASTDGQPGDLFIKIGDVVLQSGGEGQPTTVLVSLGKPEKIAPNTFRRAGCEAAKWLLRHHARLAAVDARHFPAFGIPMALQAFCEGLALGSYRFFRYKKPEVNYKGIQVTLRGDPADLAELARLAEKVNITIRAVNMTRDWANEPANVINPVTLAERASQLAERHGLKCTILDDSQLTGMGAGAITSVGKGSSTPARMIILEYPGSGDGQKQKPVVLVGKAITFDTGGYSLKDVNAIRTMKFDKSGGMVVLGVLKAAAELRLKTPLVGIICAAENMISGGAYRPDDIINSLSGKTIEIVTTDAEGRLVLADGLTYAQRYFQPRSLIDIATLTGGIVTALGKFRAGLFSNDDALAEQLFAAGVASHERLWRMPLDDDYFVNMKGVYADIKNSGGRDGAPIYGALFLKQFIEEGTSWAHLDIAGVAENLIEEYYIPIGATGFGVRLLLQYLESLE